MSYPAYIVWKDDYSVGNDELDGHHKSIITIINNLYAAVQGGSAQEELTVFLERLLEYTQSHFNREEQLLEAHKFPELPSHKIIHKHMVQKTDELRKYSLQDNDKLAYEVFSFLKDWWLNHICVMDMQYSPYLKEKKD
ncbi:MAG: bacteriohemerythrin [Gemmatimonadota bacterium]|nr:bacteriohemerythrin [Gemmatimonadota bacterium]